MRRIGIVAGKGLEFDRLAPVVKKALATVPEDTQKLEPWFNQTWRPGEIELIK